MTPRFRMLESRNANPANQRRAGISLDEAPLILAVFLLAALVRAIPWQLVFRPDGVVFRDGDSYSHMWRIWNLAAKSIPLSTRDPYVNFPDGGEVLWSPAFDWVLATFVQTLGLDRAAAEMFCAWVPVVLGATSVVIAALIAARTFSRLAGWVTGIMLAVLPGGFLYTQLGYLDHHAAVTLVGTLLIGGSMSIVARGGDGPRHWSFLAGPICALALLIWAGALIHIGVIQIAMLIWVLGSASRELARSRSLRLAIAHGIAAIAILPFSLRDWEVFGDFSPLALTRFQPIWYAAGAIGLASTSLAWSNARLGRTRASRILSAGALGVFGLGLAFASIPDLASILDRSGGWFTKEVAFLADVTELKPLFFSSGETPGWWIPVQFLSPLILGLPLALLATVWSTRRPERWILLFWTSTFLALTLNQTRFINTFSVAHAIVWGGAISAFLDWTHDRASTPRARTALRSLFAISLALMFLVSSWAYYERRLRDGGVAIIDAKRPARRAVANWLATSRPVVLNADGNPTSGLLCEWSAGHELRYASGWPLHQDGFGPYVSPLNTELASRYFEAEDEDRAVEILDRLRTRYVLANFLGAGQPPYELQSMTIRLVRFHGSGGTAKIGISGRREWIPALTRHRLVFQVPHDGGGEWLYEIVAGAQLIGSAEPGSGVAVELTLRDRTGSDFSWTARARSDANGLFRLRLPYATQGAASAGVNPIGAYRLRTNRGSVEFDVTEDSVQEGTVIAAPTLGS